MKNAIMPIIRRPPRTARRTVAPRVKVWLEKEGTYVFGFGISEILAAVDETGSIKQAARSVGKSYRYVWSRVKEAERAFGRRLIDTRVGGAGTRRSALTAEARDLVAGFTALRRNVKRFVAAEFRRRFR